MLVFLASLLVASWSATPLPAIGLCSPHAPPSGLYVGDRIVVAVVDGCLGLDATHPQYPAWLPEALQPRGVDLYDFDISQFASGRSKGSTLFLAAGGLVTWRWTADFGGVPKAEGPATVLVPIPTMRLTDGTAPSLIALLDHTVPAVRSAAIERLVRDQDDPLVCMALNRFIDDLPAQRWSRGAAGGTTLIAYATAECLAPALERALFRKDWAEYSAGALVRLLGPRADALLKAAGSLRQSTP